MGFNLGDLKNMKGSLDKMREGIASMQNVIDGINVLGKSNNGKLTIAMGGRYKVDTVTIDDSLVGDKSLLEAAVTEAINDAVKKIESEAKKNILAHSKNT